MARVKVDNLWLSKPQEDLKQVNEAINRDRLILEWVQKNIDDAKKEEDVLLNKIELLKSTISDKDNIIKKKDIEYNWLIDVLRNKKNTLENEVMYLENNILLLKQNIESISKDQSQKISKLEKDFNNKKEELESNISKLENKKIGIESEIVELWTQKDNLAFTNIKLEWKNKELGYSIESKKEIEWNLNNLKKDYDWLKETINNLKSETNSKNKEIKDIEKDIVKKSKEKEVIIKEIEELESTKQEYVRQRLQITKDKEDLDSRENYIRARYEEAGLSY